MYFFNKMLPASYAALNRIARTTAPKWLRMREMHEMASRLEALPEISSWNTWKECCPVITAIRYQLPSTDLVDRAAVEPIKDQARKDGWQIDSFLSSWAPHYRHCGGVTEETMLGYQDTGPESMYDIESHEAGTAIYYMIRHCVYTAPV